MAVFNAAFPVLPGKEDAFRAFAAEVAGPRKADFTEQQKAGDIARETWTLQSTPMGSFAIVWFEGDPEEAFGDLATNQSDFSKWFRAQVLDISGVDLAAPDDSPPPEVHLDWSR